VSSQHSNEGSPVVTGSTWPELVEGSVVVAVSVGDTEVLIVVETLVSVLVSVRVSALVSAPVVVISPKSGFGAVQATAANATAEITAMRIPPA